MDEQTQAHIVCIGGGGGVSQVILGAQPYFSQRTAIVAVTDTGRSTGVARAIGAMPAPGDARNVLATLAASPLDGLPQLLQYRFTGEGLPALEGMACGNLLIAALTHVLGDFGAALDVVSSLVAPIARVLPVSTCNTHLCAELADGSIMTDELAVRGLHKPPIQRLFLADEQAAATPAVLHALATANLVAIGPGSFFTSVLATLLFNGMVDALRHTPAHVVFICNTTTQPGQTDGFCAIDHVTWLVQLLGKGVVDTVLVNRSAQMDAATVAHYAADGVQLLSPDDAEIDAIASLGVRPLVDNYTEPHTAAKRTLWKKQDTIRHNQELVGHTLWKVLKQDA